MDERFTQLADDATAGLHDDPELRLDVRAEFLAHLHEREDAYLAGGYNEEDSAELAAKSFGSPLDIAGELLEANKRRMKLRALARLCVRALLVPAAVIIALIVGLDMMASALYIRWETVSVSRPSPNSTHFPPSLELRKIDLPYPTIFTSAKDRQALAELRFLVQGDTRRWALAQQQRAIWEAHPENKAYFANYAGYLCEETITTAQQLNTFEREMRLGERIDPQNALYNYLIARGRLSLSLGERTTHYRDAVTGKKRSHTEKIVLDRHLLEQAMRELRIGMAKPQYHTYRRDLVTHWGSLLPPAHRFLNTFQRNSTNMWGNYHLDNDVRAVNEATPIYARILADEGKSQEAIFYLNAWEHLGKQVLADATEMLDVLYATAIFKSGRNASTQVYDAMGRHDFAIQTRQYTSRLLAPYDYLKLEKQKFHSRFDAGFLTSITLPMYGNHYFSKSELAPELNLYEVLEEETIVAGVVIILLLLIPYVFMLELRWHLKLRTANAAAMLLLPSWHTVMRIVGISAIMAVAGYFLLSGLLALIGWDRIIYVKIISGFLLILLVCYLAVLRPIKQILKNLQRRCATLGIQTPDKQQRRWQLFLPCIGVDLWVLASWGALQSIWAHPDNVLQNRQLIIPVVVMVVAGLLAVLPGLLDKRAEPFALYFGTIARSLIPLLASAIIITGGLIYPLLVVKERMWLNRESLIFPKNHELVMPIERRFVEDMQHRILQVGETPAATNEVGRK